jgi:hypothetical protein
MASRRHQKLYGREREVRALLDSFERVASGRVEAVLKVRHAGVGKTALVAIYEPVTRRRGYFASGKFDQLRRDVLFAGWSRLGSQQLLTERGCARRRRAIQSAAAPNGRLLLDVPPALELIIGPQPQVAELEGVESRPLQDGVPELLSCSARSSAGRSACAARLVPRRHAVGGSGEPQPRDHDPVGADDGITAAHRSRRDEEIAPTHPFMLAVDEQVGSACRWRR